MRRITLWLVSTVCAVVLLFSYRTSTMGAGSGTAAGGAPGTPPGPDSSTGSGSGSGSGGGSGGGSSGSSTVDGTMVSTRWGPVQVRVTIRGGKLVDVAAVQVPSGNRRDQEINRRAVPVLRQEALTAQSANIDSVSGATVTSDGYRESLQHALDAAHFGA